MLSRLGGSDPAGLLGGGPLSSLKKAGGAPWPIQEEGILSWAKGLGLGAAWLSWPLHTEAAPEGQYRPTDRCHSVLPSKLAEPRDAFNPRPLWGYGGGEPHLGLGRHSAHAGLGRRLLEPFSSLDPLCSTQVL